MLGLVSIKPIIAININEHTHIFLEYLVKKKSNMKEMQLIAKTTNENIKNILKPLSGKLKRFSNSFR